MDALGQLGKDWCLQLGEVPQQLKHPPLGGGRQPRNNTSRAYVCVCGGGEGGWAVLTTRKELKRAKLNHVLCTYWYQDLREGTSH